MLHGSEPRPLCHADSVSEGVLTTTASPHVPPPFFFLFQTRHFFLHPNAPCNDSSMQGAFGCTPRFKCNPVRVSGDPGTRDIQFVSAAFGNAGAGVSEGSGAIFTKQHAGVKQQQAEVHSGTQTRSFVWFGRATACSPPQRCSRTSTSYTAQIFSQSGLLPRSRSASRQTGTPGREPPAF